MNIWAQKKKKTRLWKRQSSCEVDDEIGGEVAGSDGAGVGDELAAAENAGAGGDEGGAELDDDVEEVEGVGDGAEEGDENAEAEVDLHAGGAADFGEVEVEGVEEHGDEAGDEEDVVPFRHELRSGVQDLVPPRDLLAEG